MPCQWALCIISVDNLRVTCTDSLRQVDASWHTDALTLLQKEHVHALHQQEGSFSVGLHSFLLIGNCRTYLSRLDCWACLAVRKFGVRPSFH